MECSILCLQNQENSILNLVSDSVIDELSLFSVIVESEFELNNHYLVITDIPIELRLLAKVGAKFRYVLDEFSIYQYFQSQGFDKVVESFRKSVYVNDFGARIDFYKLFLNYPIGLCEIGLVKKDDLECLETIVLHISSSKIDSIEFGALVSYVEDKGNSVWTKFSLIKHEADNIPESDRLDWLMVFCENFIEEILTKYLSHFITDKIKTLFDYSEIEGYSDDVLISDKSILWLLENLDILVPTTSYDLQKIIINNRPIIPSEILASKLGENTDNQENRLVHGFVDELLYFLENIFVLYRKEIEGIGKDKFSDVVMFYAYSRKLKRIDELKKSLNKVKLILIDEVPVTKSGLDFLNVNKIESKEHYYYVYSKLLQWLLYKGANYSVSNKFFRGISRLDELFERACYYQIFDAFIDLGYVPVLETVTENNIFNNISFVKNHRIIKLYYQMLPTDLITIKDKSNNLRPDFVLELEDSRFVILDAKYKELKNIVKYDYADLSLKYLHGIGPKNGGYLNVIGLFVLFPNNELFETFYAKDDFSLRGTKTVYPVIGSVGINFTKPVSSLLTLIEDILEI